jgi:Domain of unknown function (DUF4280)
MAEKHLVCDGATCMCKFGSTPDKLKVLTHTKEYINDTNGEKKLMASTKDIAATFEKNTFGPCKKQPIPGGFKPCQALVTEWKDFYDKITLTHSGKALTESSKATCPIGGPNCITITLHGQTAEISKQSTAKAKPEVQRILNPAVDIQSLNKKKNSGKGITLN